MILNSQKGYRVMMDGEWYFIVGKDFHDVLAAAREHWRTFEDCEDAADDEIGIESIELLTDEDVVLSPLAVRTLEAAWRSPAR